MAIVILLAMLTVMLTGVVMGVVMGMVVVGGRGPYLMRMYIFSRLHAPIQMRMAMSMPMSFAGGASPMPFVIS